jgi:hypothetical protein
MSRPHTPLADLVAVLLLAVVEEVAREKRDLRRRRAPAPREAGQRRVALQLDLPLAVARAA